MMMDRQSRKRRCSLTGRARQVLLIVLACHLAAPSAWAGRPANENGQRCAQPVLDLIGKHTGVEALTFPRSGDYPSVQNGGVVVAAACKTWPGDKSRTIAAVAYDAGVEREKQVVVAFLDLPKAEVVAVYSGAMPEDAGMTLGPESLRIDTARYELAPGVRAFGVDAVTSFSQGCGDGNVGPARTLFVRDGKTLRPVLENFYVSTWRYVRGGPSCAPEQKDELIETTYFDIGIGTSVDHGFSSSRITERSYRGSAKKPVRASRSLELHYDGQHYQQRYFEAIR
jgi:hypothetical protein